MQSDKTREYMREKSLQTARPEKKKEEKEEEEEQQEVSQALEQRFIPLQPMVPTVRQLCPCSP